MYVTQEELEGLRSAAARSGRSVAALIRDAIRQVALSPREVAALGAPGDGSTEDRSSPATNAAFPSSVRHRF